MSLKEKLKISGMHGQYSYVGVTIEIKWQVNKNIFADISNTYDILLISP